MDLTQYLDAGIVDTLTKGGYLIMLGLMIVEGPLVTITGAFLASMGLFNIFIVAFLGWIGDMVGDSFFFAIGRYGMKIFAKQTTIDTPDEKNFMKKLDTLIHSNLLLAIFIIKFTPYAPPFGFAYIGRSGISYRKFFLTSFVSCLPVPILATILGFHIETVKNYLDSPILLTLSIISLILLLVGIYFLYHFLRKKIQKKFDITEDFRPR